MIEHQEKTEAERVAFEKWAQFGMCLERHTVGTLAGQYKEFKVEFAWGAWQARAAVPAEGGAVKDTYADEKCRCGMPRSDHNAATLHCPVGHWDFHETEKFEPLFPTVAAAPRPTDGQGTVSDERKGEK
jgi:hypothetical protein